MKKTLLSLGLLLIAGASVAQVPFSTLPGAQQNYSADEHGWCGYDESRLELMQEHSIAGQTVTTGLTYRTASQSSYFEDCGSHFRVYYDDFNYSPLDGFALVSGGVGAQRRNTMCAVLQYIESVIDFTGVTDRIEIFVARSYSSTNPAPIGTGFLGQASPYYNNSGYLSNTPGFYGGNIYDHVQSLSDPYLNFYDGWTQMNFDFAYPNSGPIQLLYWDDYTNTSATCRFDLYSVLLHEITHAMGWLSRVQESASTNHPTTNTNGRRFSFLDQNYLYYGDIQTSVFTKLVDNSTINIDPNVNNNIDPVRSNKVWMNNQGTPNNHPAYSGDFTGYWATAPAPFSIGSLLSHMNFGYNSFNAMSQYSPGYRDNYVMGPAIAKELIKRVYTYFELRTLDNIGYNYDPAFAISTSLNGVEQNQNLLNNNHTPAKTNQWQSTEFAVWSMNTLSFGECMAADATIALNNNTTTNPNTTSIVINVSSLGTDADGDGVKVYSVGGVPEIFNIRGCGDGNNHNQLVVNGAGTTITYTPRVGFKGRAQFGMFLFDGREKGAFRVVTIDVTAFGPAFLASLPTAPEMVMNGSNEQGTEARQRVINENINNTGIEYGFLEGLFMSGGNFTDGRPTYNLSSNNWTLGGGSYLQNTYNNCGFINNGRKGTYGHANIDWNNNGYNAPLTPRPIPNTVTNPNERYCQFIYNVNYIPLIIPAQSCHVYRLEFDVNMQRTTNITVGQQYTINVQFTGTPGCSVPSVLYTVPVTFTVTTLSPNVWQHVSQDIYYCGPTSSWINIDAPNPPATQAPLYDNISLHEISIPPLAVTASASPTSICSGNPTTLTAVATNTLCTTTYTWQPGNLNGASVVVSPTTTTTYTVSVNDGCTIQTATVLVTVQPGNGPTTWPKFMSGATSVSNFTSVISDGQGNIYATGMIRGQTTIPSFGTITPTNQELIVVKYNEQCGGVWLRRIAGNVLQGYDITLDNSGNVLVVGSFTGTNVNFGNSQILTSGGSSEAFLLKLNTTTGNTIFAKQTTSPVPAAQSAAVGKAVKYDAVNNAIYVTGDFQGTVKFGTLANVVSVGGRDVFVTRYSAAGVEAWSKQIGSTITTANDIAGSIGTTSTGVVYVGCSVAGSVTVPVAATNTNPGTHDLFIVNLAAATGAYGGNNIIRGNSTASVYLKDMFVDPSGKCFITGQYKGTLTIGNTLATASTENIFYGSTSSLLVFNTTSIACGSANAASTQESGNSIWMYNNDIYITGSAYNGATFSGFTPSTFSSTNGHEVFVIRLVGATTPNFLETSISTGGAAINVGLGITVSPSTGAIFTCGALGITAGPLPSVTFNPPALAPLSAQQGFIARSNSSAFFRLGNPELNINETQADNTIAEQTLMSTSPDLIFNAYPNPTDGLLHIVLPSNQQSTVNVLVMDISGRTVKTEMMKPNDQGQLIIDLSGLEEGVYLISTNSNGQVNTGRIILRR